jgi:hypothetical protein
MALNAGHVMEQMEGIARVNTDNCSAVEAMSASVKLTGAQVQAAAASAAAQAEMAEALRALVAQFKLTALEAADEPEQGDANADAADRPGLGGSAEQQARL